MKNTGVILAGGMSRRMGRDKGTLLLGKQTVVEHVIETVSQVVDEMILICNKPEIYRRFGVPIFADVLPAKGALVGIHAGLVASKTEHSLFVACDIPFVKKRFLDYMLSKLEHKNHAEDAEIVVPRSKFGYEPLCAIYSQRCVPEIESMVNNNVMRVSSLLEKFNTCVISEEEISALDSEGSFFNINSKDDYKKAKDYLKCALLFP